MKRNRKPVVASLTVTVNGVTVSQENYDQDYQDVQDAMLAFSDADDLAKADEDFHCLYHRMESEHGSEYAQGMIERVADETVEAMGWSAE